MIKKWITCVAIIFVQMSCFAEYKYYLSICALFRDEAPYMKEWIEFHRIVGVEHFYLCSNNGTDNYMKVLAPYIESGIVELTEVTTSDVDENGRYLVNPYQAPHYNIILEKSRGESRWVAFLDSDEYLYPVQADSLALFLKDYEEFGGLGVNWHMFGTSHVAKLNPKKTLIEQLTHCAPHGSGVNTHVKTVLQPELALQFLHGVHHCDYIEGSFQVNADKLRFEGPLTPYVSSDLVRINHYWTRDEYYMRKFKISLVG